MSNGPTRVGVALVVCLLVGSAFAAPAFAGDSPGLLDFDPSESEVDPGETIEVDVTLSAMAGYDDNGVQSFGYTVAYDPEVLAVADVEIGPWMHQEAETEVTYDTTIDDDAGRVTVEQARDPPAGGVSDTGDTPTATITFEVSETADPSTAVLQFEDAHSELIEGFPLPVLHSREAAIHIDGGGEERIPLEDDDDDDGVTFAEEDGETEDGETAGSDAAEDPDEDQHGFGVAAGLVAFVCLVLLKRRGDG
ncbi:MAG: cohesin domain-containing protein [Natronomonas sp.]